MKYDSLNVGVALFFLAVGIGIAVWGYDDVRDARRPD